MPNPKGAQASARRGVVAVFRAAVDDHAREEDEHEISAAEYAELLKRADAGRKPVHKTRYCLDYMGQLFEIDVYPFWTDRAIMEIELDSEEREVMLPPSIEVIKEVTGDGRYTNAAIAREVPAE